MPNTERQLNGSTWFDTYPPTRGQVKISNIEESGDDVMLTIKAEYNDNYERKMLKVNFLEYISYGRFEPRDNPAKRVQETVNCSSKFASM